MWLMSQRQNKLACRIQSPHLKINELLERCVYIIKVAFNLFTEPNSTPYTDIFRMRQNLLLSLFPFFCACTHKQILRAYTPGGGGGASERILHLAYPESIE
jgi:hypothetical protein